VLAGALAGMGVGDENRQGEPSSVGKQSLDALRAGAGFEHLAVEERRVFGVEERMVGEQAQQRDHGGGFGVVAVLQLLVAMQRVFAVLLMDGAEAQRVSSGNWQHHDYCQSAAAV
jgi:hypothetical protein